jgi:hypothetical protein
MEAGHTQSRPLLSTLLTIRQYKQSTGDHEEEEPAPIVRPTRNRRPNVQGLVAQSGFARTEYYLHHRKDVILAQYHVLVPYKFDQL